MRFQISVFAVAVLSAVLAAPASADAQSAEEGHALFLSNGCWQCHGTVGQGAATGPRLAPDPLPVEALTNFVHYTNGDMPPFRPDILSDPDLADIHAYLASIPKPPAVASLPLDTFASPHP
jgi:ubiquinol-cytochrome c reductase cytochrome c subunit